MWAVTVIVGAYSVVYVAVAIVSLCVVLFAAVWHLWARPEVVE